MDPSASEPPPTTGPTTDPNAEAATTADREAAGATAVIEDPTPGEHGTSADAAPAAEAPTSGRHSRRRAADGTGDRTDRVFPAPAGTMALQTLGVATAAWLLIAYLYRIWDAVMRRPIANRDGDMNQIEMMVKNITETGWFLHGPRIGAPWGQQYFDVPHGGETLQLFFVKLITVFVKSTGLTVNIYYLFGFGLLAAVTFLVLRHLRFGPVISAAVALGYAFLPYHFTHGEGHLWRSTYYSVPLACLVILWSQSWRTRYLVDPAGGTSSWWQNVRWKRVVATLVLCTVIGSTETMSTYFTVILLGSVGIIGAIRWREWQRLLTAALPALAIGLTFVACSLPSLWFWHVHGKNDVAGRRTVAEGERYGLKLTRLLMPSDGSRVKALDDFADRAKENSTVGLEGGQSLGILGAAACLGLLYGAIAGPRQTRGPNGDPRAPDDRGALREYAALTTIIAVLFGTVAGFSIITSVLGFSQIRTWGRISIFIAFFVALQVAVWGEQIAAWARRRHAGVARPALGALAVVVLAVSIGLNPAIRVYDPGLMAARWNSDRRFVAQIESIMSEGSSIFQMPIMRFPEVHAPVDMHDYDPLRAYLADNGKLHWSYGAVKGRPDADWQLPLRDEIGPVVGLPGIMGMGFSGLWIDKAGYGEGPEARYELIHMRRLLGEPTLTSSSGRFWFYDLRPYRDSLPYTDEQLRQFAEEWFDVAPPPAPRPYD